MRQPPVWPRPVEDPNTYRVPVPGDRVSLRAMRRRPELTGTSAQVVSGMDVEGFVTVRLGQGDESSLKQVHIERLRPLDPPSEKKEAGRVASVASASGQSRMGSSRASMHSQKLRSRPSSAVRDKRPPSRPTSATEASRNGDAKPRLSPDEIQQQLIRQRLGPYQAAAAYAAGAAKSAISRSRPESSGQVPVSFLTSPQKRMEDAWQHLPAGSEEERQALYEDGPKRHANGYCEGDESIQSQIRRIMGLEYFPT
eukprot:symbB.v1.2.024807.t1/scaffold2371.1/size80895/3